MKPTDFPFVDRVVRFSGNDRVLDGLILLGPIVISLIAIVGRSSVTTGLAAAYVIFFPLYVLYKSRVA